MVLVHALGVIYTAIQLRHIVLREANNSLNVYENVKNKAKTCVRGFEVCMAWSSFVHLDDDKAGCKRRRAHDVEKEVGKGAGALLFRGVRGLKDECCLDGEEEAGLVGYQWYGCREGVTRVVLWLTELRSCASIVVS